MTNTKVPPLGRRGEGWLALQSLALAATGVAGVAGPSWPPAARTPLLVVGVLAALGGGALGAAGIRELGPSLTALPMPSDGAPVRDRGAYGLVRHPIYGGIVLVALGWAAATSPAALVPTAALTLVFDGKRRVEEAWLAERHPGYGTYAQRVRRRFVPFVW